MNPSAETMKRRTFAWIKLVYRGILAILLLLLSGLPSLAQDMPTPTEPGQALDETALSVSLEAHKCSYEGLPFSSLNR